MFVYVDLCFVCTCELAIPLADSQCQTEWSGRYGSFAEDCWVINCWEPQEAIYGWLHLCM